MKAKKIREASEKVGKGCSKVYTELTRAFNKRKIKNFTYVDRFILEELELDNQITGQLLEEIKIAIYNES